MTLRLLRIVWRRVSFAHWRCLRRIAALERKLDRDAARELKAALTVEELFDPAPGAVCPVHSPGDVQVLLAHSASSYAVVCIDVPRSARSVTAG